MKIFAIAVFAMICFSAPAQVIDTIGPKNNEPVWRGPKNQNTDPIVKPTYTDTIKRQAPQGTNPQPNWMPPKDASQPQPGSPTQPSVPPTNTNPTSPPTPTIPRDPNNAPPPKATPQTEHVLYLYRC